MNSTRTIFRIHSWMGLATGAIMFVLSVTGAYLVYGAEFDRLFNPDIRTLPAAAHPASLDSMLAAVRGAFPDHHIGLITFPVDGHAPYVASLRKIMPGGEFARYQVYLDPGTGAIVGHRVSNHYLTSWILRLHEGLWLPERWGQPLVAILGVIMALLGLTGLWVYRKRIWEALMFRKSAARIGRFHSHVGVWSMLFAIVIGITGTVLNWSSVLVVCRAPPVPEMGSEWGTLDGIPKMDALLAASHGAFPDLEAHGIYFPSKPGDPVKVGGYAPGARILGKSSYVAFAPSTPLRVVAVYDARKASLPKRMLFMCTSLHYGDFGGDASKIPYVIGGFAMMALAFTGLWIGLRPRRRT